MLKPKYEILRVKQITNLSKVDHVEEDYAIVFLTK